MKRHAQWAIACNVLWLSACSTLPRPVGPDTPERRQAAVQTRWIGVPKNWTGKCPAFPATDWRVHPLVSLKELEPSLARSVQKSGLDRFCVYEYKGDARVSRDLRPPRKILAQLRSVEPDRLALSSMSSLQATALPQFSQRFFEQVQSLAPLPGGATGRVRLVFLDTQPTGEGIPGGTPKSRHGYALGHIAGRLAGYPCGSNCTVEVASRLALPVVRFDPEFGTVLERNEITGGFRGTFTDLCLAIVNEIKHWKSLNSGVPPGSTSRLVLNLSIGWDGEKLSGWGKEDLADALELDPEEWNENELLAPSAVYRALKVAADQDVLVIAAAGNERGGPEPTGLPLLPGGWENRYLPYAETEWDWEDIGNPLIYAASGVDGFGRQLVTTRWRGEAPRVAYADHVAVRDLHSEPNEEYTATLTGTSVASAVISTIAAIVWSYKPSLEPKDVMALLDQSGTNPLGRHHDFAAPQNPQEVQRITLCQALAKVWSIPTVPPEQPLPSPAPTCGNIPQPAPINLSTFNPTSIVDLGGQPLPDLPLPFRPHRDTQDQPLCGPQPGVNPCPNCVVDPDPPNSVISNPIALAANRSSNLYQSLLTNDYKLLVELPSPEWGLLKGATLEIFEVDDFGKRKGPPSGSSISLPAGNTLKVTFPDPGVPFQAALTFTLAPDANTPPESYLSVVNPLFVNSPVQ